VDRHTSSRHAAFGGTIVLTRMGGKRQLVSSVFADADRMPNAALRPRVTKARSAGGQDAHQP
jgi:hypothetical protein